MVVVLNNGFQIDNFISQNINYFRGSADGFFIFLGHYLRTITIGLAVFIIFFMYLQKRKKESLMVLLALVSGFILEQTIKYLVQRPRPVAQLIQETSYSFPSGHSIFAIILFSMLIYFYKDKIKNSFFKVSFIMINVFLILLTGVSRIYLNVHWFSDVLGGFAIGFAVMGCILFFIFEK